MSKFDRKLSKEFMDQMTSDVVLGENSWLCDMFRYWRPPGDLIGKHLGQQHVSTADDQGLDETPTHLRLAIRNGYTIFIEGGSRSRRLNSTTAGSCRQKSITNMSTAMPVQVGATSP